MKTISFFYSLNRLSYFNMLLYVIFDLYTVNKRIKKGQSRETGNIGYIRRRKTKQKLNTIYVGHHYTQTNTNNTNKKLRVHFCCVFNIPMQNAFQM
jgi:hypothetical protein